MHALFDAGNSLCAAHRFDHAIARDWRPIRQAQDALAGAERPSLRPSGAASWVCRDLE